MGIIERWIQHSSPLVKITMAVGAASAFVVGMKLVYAPYVKRKRLHQAEAWADSIIEQEERIMASDNS